MRRHLNGEKGRKFILGCRSIRQRYTQQQAVKQPSTCHRLSFPFNGLERKNYNATASRTITSFTIPTKNDAIELLRLMNNRPGSLIEDDSDCLRYNEDWTVSCPTEDTHVSS